MMKMKPRFLMVVLFFLVGVCWAGQAQRLTILYDNIACEGSPCQTDWGFACLMEGWEKTVLLDTGLKGNVFLANATTMAVDLNEVDVVVLSHDHRDHFGGLEAFLKVNSDVDVYLLDAFSDDRSATVEKYGARLKTVTDSVQICDGVWLTGTMRGGIKEQAVVLKTKQGTVVVTGCAHPGIVPMVKKAKTLVPGSIHFVCGGFHMIRHGESEIESAVKAFKALGVRYAGPSHCSGQATMETFREAYGDYFVDLGAGRGLDLSKLGH